VELDKLTVTNGKPVFLDTAGKTIVSPKPILRAELNPALTVQKFVGVSGLVFVNGLGNVHAGGYSVSDNGAGIEASDGLCQSAVATGDFSGSERAGHRGKDFLGAGFDIAEHDGVYADLQRVVDDQVDSDSEQDDATGDGRTARDGRREGPSGDNLGHV
jgi:hypothetical protein